MEGARWARKGKVPAASRTGALATPPPPPDEHARKTGKRRLMWTAPYKGEITDLRDTTNTAFNEGVLKGSPNNEPTCVWCRP